MGGGAGTERELKDPGNTVDGLKAATGRVGVL